MAAKDYPGLIGAEFLRRFTVVFNNRDKRIWLTPNAAYKEPAVYDRSGLRLRAEGPGFRRFVVARIVPQSPAGIEPGDVLESSDHISAQEMTLTEVHSLLCRPKGVMQSRSCGVIAISRCLCDRVFLSKALATGRRSRDLWALWENSRYSVGFNFRDSGRSIQDSIAIPQITRGATMCPVESLINARAADAPVILKTMPA